MFSSIYVDGNHVRGFWPSARLPAHATSTRIFPCVFRTFPPVQPVVWNICTMRSLKASRIVIYLFDMNCHFAQLKRLSVGKRILLTNYTSFFTCLKSVKMSYSTAPSGLPGLTSHKLWVFSQGVKALNCLLNAYRRNLFSVWISPSMGTNNFLFHPCQV